jgi:hypothetical protein
MRVLWITDFGIHHNIGGSQRTDSFIIEEGKRRGVEIDFVHFDYTALIESVLPADSIERYNYVVSGNLEVIYTRRKDIWNYLLSCKNHVRLEHDANSYLSKEDREKLFGSTIQNIFLSEYHYDQFRIMYGDIFGKNWEVVASPIPSEQFFDQGKERKDATLERKDATLYCGFFHYLKGTANFIETVLNNPDKKYAVAGWGENCWESPLKYSFDNVEWLGKVNHSQMANLYNSYKTLYYHPNKFEQLDCSDNIGAVQMIKRYNLDFMRERCNNSPKKFWELLS